ncbi:DUF2510 domain-containing protein [Streptacidiphilus sp. PAMC 29251]
MSTTTPAGWYPDPKPNDPAHPGQRWWNGSEWTVSTKSDEVLTIGPVPAKRPRPRRGTVLAGTVAALLGLGVGSLTTYLIMDGRNSTTNTSSAPPQRFNSGGVPGEGGSGGTGGSGGSGGLPTAPSAPGGSGGSGGGSGGLPGGGGADSTTAVDLLDGLSLPIPAGWTGGTTQDGHAGLSIGKYSCSQSTDGCTLGGANTETLKASVSDGAKAAAEADIAGAVKEAYGDVNSHQQLEAQAVTVAGRSGYLIRWKVDAKVGNDGTVETVVFPTSDNKTLVALHLGFDTAAKAPALSVMDTIVAGIKDVDTASLSGGATGGTGGTTGSNS